MKRCTVCEGILPESQFPPGSTTCRICAKKLKEDANTSHGVRRSILQAHLELLAAIREQADAEDDYDTWADYWLKDPWDRLWALIRDEGDRQDSIYRFHNTFH